MGIGWGAVLEEAGHPGGVFGAATVTGLGVPVQRDATVHAAYPLVFLLAPLVNANLLLTADILQTIAMVWHTAVAETGDEVAGEVRAVGTASNPRLTGSTLCYLAPVKRYAGASFMQAAFAGDLFHGYIQLLTKSLQDSLRIFPFCIVPDAVYATGTAVYSTDGSEMFTFHNYFTFLVSCASTQINGIVFIVGMSRQAVILTDAPDSS